VSTEGPHATRLRDGVRAAVPLAPGPVLFGLSFGVLADAAGMSAVAATAMSATTFAGSAQFAAVSVLDAGGTILAALPLRGVAPELAVVRQRVIIAMIVVLGLAALAGVAIARVLGGRIRRLASTAATLAGGDLSARAPQVGVAPEEISTLGESLNGMAERLESLVAEITSERDRDRAMIGSLAEGVIAVDPDGAVVVANDAAGRLLGLPEGAESARLVSSSRQSPSAAGRAISANTRSTSPSRISSLPATWW